MAKRSVLWNLCKLAAVALAIPAIGLLLPASAGAIALGPDFADDYSSSTWTRRRTW